MGSTVVVLETDPKLARSLAGRLRSHSYSVHFTRSGDELRETIIKNQPQAVVLDIECARLAEIERLHRDFPGLPIVCTHRIPDEEMWMAALEAGAIDVCPSNDVNNVLMALLRGMATTRGVAA
jgi:DNA-binding response OmpR family regulator